MDPQLWAEDGGLFLIEADAHDWSTIFRPYSGYLHLIPRLIALLGSYLPMLWIPTFYAACALAVTGTVIWYLQSPRILLPGKLIAALAVVAVPHTGEAYLAICNLQWITGLALFASCIAVPPGARLQRWGDLTLLIAFGMTGPFIVLALPVLALRWIRQRTRWNVTLIATALILAVGHLRPILHRDQEGSLPSVDTVRLVAFCGRRVFVQPFLGETTIGIGGAFIVTLVVLVSFAIGIWRNRVRLPGAPALGMFVVLVLAAITVKSRPDLWNYSDSNNGDRYFFIPKVLSVWLLSAILLGWRGRARNIGIAVLFAIPLVALRNFIYLPAPPQNWRHYAERIESGQPTTVPILPEGFTFKHPGRRHSM